jgi:hypothetical protein
MVMTCRKAEVLVDERKETAAALWRRVSAWFAGCVDKGSKHVERQRLLLPITFFTDALGDVVLRPGTAQAGRIRHLVAAEPRRRATNGINS